MSEYQNSLLYESIDQLKNGLGPTEDSIKTEIVKYKFDSALLSQAQKLLALELSHTHQDIDDLAHHIFER